MTVAATGCGSDSNNEGSASTDSTSSAASSTPAPASSTESAASSTVVSATNAPGSTAETTDRTGQTIKIGLVNEDNGPFTFPEFRFGAEVAFQRINDNGGINGAQIELVSCSVDLTPESSVDCANQLVEADVAAAFIGIDLTSDAALPVYQEAGIPYITSNNWGEIQATAEGAHLLHVATEAAFVSAFELASTLGAKKLAFLYENNPANVNNVENIMPPISETYGIPFVAVSVDGAAPDWTAAVASANAQGAELMYGQNSEPGCTAMVKAIRASNFDGPIGAGLCSKFQFDLGEDANGVYTVMDQLQPSAKGSAPATIAAHLKEYEQLMSAAGHDEYIEGYAVWPYGAANELGTVLSTISGDINGASVEAALDADVTIPGWLGPDLNCGAEQWPSSPNSCTATIGVFQTETDGTTVVRNEVIPFFDAYKKLQSKG